VAERGALECLEGALSQAPQDSIGPLLLSKASVFEQRRDFEAALAILEEAEPNLDAERDPRHLAVLQFNRAVNLCHLGRFAAAEPLLPEIRARALALRTELDLLRTSWLEARVAIGLGRTEEGITALEQVAEEFRTRGLAYDGALVHLNLAMAELEQGKTATVKERAAAMWWIFQAGQLHREAAAALDLFCQAARREAATVELVRRVQEYLERAERNPALRFPG
jgi:tetratricopeptide (TPR) repeat protein